jgi:hypothetical protein
MPHHSQPATPDAVILGVDLGLRGALAALRLTGDLAALVDMPTTAAGAGRPDYDLPALTAWLDHWASRARALAIEYVHAMPRRLGGSIASFALGRASGLFEMWAWSRRVPIEIIPPAVWQRAMIPVRRGQGRQAVKHAAQLAAVRLFPRAPLDSRRDAGRADALLIAEFARRLHVGAPITTGTTSDSARGPARPEPTGAPCP